MSGTFIAAQGQGFILESSSTLTQVVVNTILEYTGTSTTMLFPAPAANAVAGFINSTSQTINLSTAGGSFYTPMGVFTTIQIPADGGSIFAISDGTNWYVIAQPPSLMPTLDSVTTNTLIVVDDINDEGTLEVAGVAGFANNVGIAGVLTVSNNALIDESLTVLGSIITNTIAGPTDTLSVNGNLSITSEVTIGASLTVDAISSKSSGGDNLSITTNGGQIYLVTNGGSVSISADSGSATITSLTSELRTASTGASIFVTDESGPSAVMNAPGGQVLVANGTSQHGVQIQDSTGFTTIQVDYDGVSQARLGLYGYSPVVQPLSGHYGAWISDGYATSNVVNALRAIGILGT
jgi:hypothetical protein